LPKNGVPGKDSVNISLSHHGTLTPRTGQTECRTTFSGSISAIALKGAFDSSASRGEYLIFN
jgi:hypothetical protein